MKLIIVIDRLSVQGHSFLFFVLLSYQHGLCCEAVSLIREKKPLSGRLYTPRVMVVASRLGRQHVSGPNEEQVLSDQPKKLSQSDSPLRVLQTYAR